VGRGTDGAESDVAAIHDVEGPRLQEQLVEGGDVVPLPLGNADEARDPGAQVQRRMELHRGLALAKARPGEQRQAQVDRRRIEGVGRLRQFNAQILLGIQLPGALNESLGHVRIDAPVGRFVGVGQRAPGDAAAQAGMVELRPQGAQAGLDVAQTLPVGELGEGHAEELVEAREPSDAVMAAIAPHAPVEVAFRQEVHELREHQSSRMHWPLLSVAQ